MTAPRKRKSPPKVADFQELRGLLRSVQLRATQSRVAVLQWLQQASGPMTHAEVADALAERGFDRTSVYRNLVELAEANLLTRLELGDHVWRYEVRGQAAHNREDHLHFLCDDCGNIRCLPGVSIQKALSTAAGHAVGGTVSDILIKGRCADCGPK